jgi:hypothetical protein
LNAVATRRRLPNIVETASVSTFVDTTGVDASFTKRIGRVPMMSDCVIGAAAEAGAGECAFSAAMRRA